MRSGFRFLLLAATLALGACVSAPNEQEVQPEEAYYDKARSAMSSGNFNVAERNLDLLETYYPFGRYAEQAQLDLIYARYQNLDLEGARTAADRFLRLHPQSEHADYALYMRGLASYNLDVGLATRYLGVDPTDRDPGEQRQAFRDFSELLSRYPDSEYAPDARQRMIAIRNRLAELELHAANYYIRRQAYVAANNRARYVVENFPSTPSTEEALILMAETYRVLELDDAAKDAVRLLAVNYPESKAFNSRMEFQGRDLTPENRSLLNAITFGLLGRD
ncbi:Beta-barrel assembly machine subunit BamD [Marinobacter daqiaonensis]|uniref:Outer membrane protein assembly factor BamD n=1 Tax=Marinobacter daqiaonensis TaxID=650891 RepID=A0A1I6K697_9GAMM|nr:outer membrane protein assembly factor BamD [Marinobacter daqiaonensis]SFR86598.1 Beta-barrel assembly machine subunit BamD [Marinobacter daqiaonensis]